MRKGADEVHTLGSGKWPLQFDVLGTWLCPVPPLTSTWGSRLFLPASLKGMSFFPFSFGSTVTAVDASHPCLHSLGCMEGETQLGEDQKPVRVPVALLRTRNGREDAQRRHGRRRGIFVNF